MLVLTRKENETIRIGDDIVITLIKTSGGKVRIGVDAPKSVKVLRGELEPVDGAELDTQIFAHGQPLRADQTRPVVPMATSTAPQKSQPVTRRRLTPTQPTPTPAVSA